MQFSSIVNDTMVTALHAGMEDLLRAAGSGARTETDRKSRKQLALFGMKGGYPFSPAAVKIICKIGGAFFIVAGC